MAEAKRSRWQLEGGGRVCSGEGTLLSGRAKWRAQREGVGHSHPAPHSVSLSGPMHPAVEDGVPSLLKCLYKGRRKYLSLTHTQTPPPAKALTVFRSQTLSWLCSLPPDQTSWQEGVGVRDKGELRLYLATQIKQTTNGQVFQKR